MYYWRNYKYLVLALYFIFYVHVEQRVCSPYIQGSRLFARVKGILGDDTQHVIYILLQKSNPLSNSPDNIIRLYLNRLFTQIYSRIALFWILLETVKLRLNSPNTYISNGIILFLKKTSAWSFSDTLSNTLLIKWMSIQGLECLRCKCVWARVLYEYNWEQLGAPDVVLNMW